MDRNQKILANITPETQHGLEIGPLDRPIVTRETGDVRYVDHATTEELQAKYKDHANVNIDRIVEVDYVWGSQSIPELVGDVAPFDYVIASHVIEHVPDFIGWLEEIHTILKPGGILSLVIPDKRYCFDYFRYPTKAAEVIEAYFNRVRKPSLRQIFDHFASAALKQGDFVWAEVATECDLTLGYSIEQAWEITKQAFDSGSYCDAHCWVFTPQTFFELLKTLIRLNLVHFQVLTFFETEGCEFYISLQAIAISEVDRDAQSRQLGSLPKFDIPISEAFAESELRAMLKQTCHDLKHAQEKLREEQQLVQQLNGRIHQLEGEINAMETSKFWKLRKLWFQLKKNLHLTHKDS